MEPLALVAGEGTLPKIVCETAQKRGVPVVAVAFSKKCAKSIERLADVAVFGIGEANKVVNHFKKKNCKRICLIGKIEKKLVFENVNFDMRAIKLLGKTIRKDDSSIMRAIIREFEIEGFSVEKQTEWIPSLMPKPGLLGAHPPSERVSADIEYGIHVCRQLADMEIGQTILVKDGVVLSVEAVEGTDSAIDRGCSLGGKGAVMIKAGRMKQDLRFDIPTVGLSTVKRLRANHAAALAIEAGNVVVTDIEEVVAACDDAGIVFTAV